MKKKILLTFLLALAVCFAAGLSACGECQHNWQTDSATAATCTVAGSRTEKCTVCNETRTVNVTALGHKLDGAWEANATAHWQTCRREGCSARENNAAHTFAQDVCTVCARGDTSGTEGVTISWSTTPGSMPLDIYYVSGYTGSATEVKIPAYYDDGVHGLHPVKGIGVRAFQNKNITAITLPDSVVTVGYEAFAGTDWLAAQPDGVIYVGKVAYGYKGSLPADMAITIADGTLAISEWAFVSSPIKSVTIPGSVQKIGRYAFYNCLSLDTVTLGEGVQMICGAAFSYCESLETVTIPNSVTILGESSFEFCKRLTSVTIGNGVKEIHNNLFSSCEKLTTVTIALTRAKLAEATVENAVWYVGCPKDLTIVCTDGSLNPLADA